MAIGHSSSEMRSIPDVDNVMYDCGIEVLHPGGLQKTDEMARACGVADGRVVLDVGCGRGTTACHLARRYGCRVVGLDAAPDMIEAAQERARKRCLDHLVSFRVGDAYELPFEDQSFDIIVIECVTTLLDRTRAFSELARVLRSGGRLGDLEMIYRRPPPEAFARKLTQAWEGFTTMPLEEWRTLFERHGLEVVAIDDFSVRLADYPITVMKELGLRGIINMIGKLVRHVDVRRAMTKYARIFREGRRVFGYAYLVGVKTPSVAG